MTLRQELLSKASSLELKATQIVEGFLSGKHRSPFHGFSVEFAGQRPYQPGDDLRHLDWKAYAKRERLYLKQYQEETNMRLHLVLDVSRSMEFRHFAEWSKAEYAIHLAASLLVMASRQRDACGLTTFNESDRVEDHPASSRPSHIRWLIQSLEERLQNPGDAGAAGPTSGVLSQILHERAETMTQRGMVVVITDLFQDVANLDDLFSALRHLRHARHEVLLLNIQEHRSEREFDLGDDAFRLVDMETGGKMTLSPRQIRKTYMQEMDRYLRTIREECNRSHVAFEEMDTMKGFEPSLLAFIRRRAMVSR